MVNPANLLNSPQAIHAAMVHFPVALGILGMLLLFLCVFTQMSNVTLRWLAFACYLGMAAVAFATILSGEAALSASPAIDSPEVKGLLSWHQAVGQKLWIAALSTAVLILLCGVQSASSRSLFTVLAVLGSFLTAVCVILVASTGTTLVFEHGVGVAPQLRAPSQPNPPAPPPPTPIPPAQPSPAAASPVQNVPPVTPPTTPPPALAQPAPVQPNSPGQPPAATPPVQIKPPPPIPAPAAKLAPKPPAKSAEAGPYTQWIQSWWRDVKRAVWP